MVYVVLVLVTLLVIGNVQILDCQGEELYNLQDEFPDGNFGYDTVSDQFTPMQNVKLSSSNRRLY